MQARGRRGPVSRTGSRSVWTFAAGESLLWTRPWSGLVPGGAGLPAPGRRDTVRIVREARVVAAGVRGRDWHPVQGQDRSRSRYADRATPAPPCAAMNTGKSSRFPGLPLCIRNAGCIPSGFLRRSRASCCSSMFIIAGIGSACSVSWQPGQGRRSGHGTGRPGLHTLVRSTRTIPGRAGGCHIRSGPGKRLRRGTTTGIDARCFSRIFRGSTSRQSRRDGSPGYQDHSPGMKTRPRRYGQPVLAGI